MLTFRYNLRKTPVFPIFGSGRYSLQPVARENVAAGFIKALELPETIGHSFEVGGPEPIPYRQMLQRITARLGRKAW